MAHEFHGGPESFLPLKSLEFEILLCLAGGDRHGYAILTEVESRSRGLIQLHPGTLYRNLNRLLQSGLLEESGDRPDPSLDDQRRRYYRMTELGRRVAALEASRLAAQIRQAKLQGLVKESPVGP